METGHNPQLTAAEIASLWTSYLDDSMAICVLKHFIVHVVDEEIRSVLEYALHLSKEHIETLTGFYKKEDLPIPYGFTHQDLNLDAPRLYSDYFFLNYIINMAKFGSNSYTVALSNAARADMRTYFTECVASSAELFNRAVSISLSKGLFVRPPYIPPYQTEYVQKQGFLTGWFGKRRPLAAIEIMNLFFNQQRNAVGSSLLTGFSQVTQSQKVREYMIRGKDIADKHNEIFGSILREDDLPAPMYSDSEVTQSMVSPFSDKLMMFHTTALIAASVGYYGASMGSSPRHDLSVQYSRLSAEIGRYADDGAKIMIDHGWLEQPPLAPDRVALSKGTK